jgi:hypothetical protein
MALFNPSRDQVRQFFFDTWAKFQQQQSLTDLEGIALQVIQMHPEYYVVLNTSEKYMDQAYFPEMGETNPFLHMSLHMSILEQISINQPIGIADAYQRLRAKHGNESDAQHDLMDCLAETIWQAQRTGQSLDGAAYLERIKAKLV